MARRRLLLVFLTYLTLDLSTPFVAGAFNFNPDECVEGLHRVSSSHQRADAPVILSRAPVVRVVVSLPSPVRPLARGRHAILEWLADSRADLRASGDPPPPSEDH